VKTQIRRKRRSRWFSDRSWREYWIETRTISDRVELHALHFASGHRYIAKADRLEVAAANLIALIHSHRSDDEKSPHDKSPPPSSKTRPKTQLLWRHAAKVIHQLTSVFKPAAR
jgi:hypothetical protein